MMMAAIVGGCLTPGHAVMGETQGANSSPAAARCAMMANTTIERTDDADARSGQTPGSLSLLARPLALTGRAVLLATEASIVLLDEPLAGVGSGDVAGLVGNIRDLQREKGCTVLMVEHHIDVLMGLVDKVAVMYFGTILAYDTPQNVMADPTVQSAYLGTGAA